MHDEVRFFKFITLEGAQAGLSWETILKKRAAYREAFCGFDPALVARMNSRSIERLMNDDGIVRNRLKIASTLSNARAFLAIQDAYGSFDAYVWQFVGGAPIVNHPRVPGDVPAQTAMSTALSKDLSKRGFRFVGSTICYAFMQATGLVDDHLVGCFRKTNSKRR